MKPQQCFYSRSSSRSVGPMTFLRCTFPVQLLTERSLRNRCLILSLFIHDASLYIHNVYAPMRAEESVIFQWVIALQNFPIDRNTPRVGDVNTLLDSAISASSETIRHEPSRVACLKSLSQVGVVEAWRIQIRLNKYI